MNFVCSSAAKPKYTFDFSEEEDGGEEEDDDDDAASLPAQPCKDDFTASSETKDRYNDHSNDDEDIFPPPKQTTTTVSPAKKKEPESIFSSSKSAGSSEKSNDTGEFTQQCTFLSKRLDVYFLFLFPVLCVCLWKRILSVHMLLVPAFIWGLMSVTLLFQTIWSWTVTRKKRPSHTPAALPSTNLSQLRKVTHRAKYVSTAWPH